MGGRQARRGTGEPQLGDRCPVCKTGTLRLVQTRWGPNLWCSVCQPRIARLEPESGTGERS